MSDLALRLADKLAAGHLEDLADLRNDAGFAPPDLRQAAVLIAVTDRPAPGVILLHRPTTMRAHPGQVAFPGGRCDPGEDAIAAALREADEELAISPDKVTIIGSTDPFVTATGYDVVPVLAVIPPDLPIRPNPEEVSDWFEAPLGFLLDPTNYAHREAEWLGAVRPYVEIMWQEHRIWGVTAAIIANLARRLAWP